MRLSLPNFSQNSKSGNYILWTSLTPNFIQAGWKCRKLGKFHTNPYVKNAFHCTNFQKNGSLIMYTASLFLCIQISRFWHDGMKLSSCDRAVWSLTSMKNNVNIFVNLLFLFTSNYKISHARDNVITVLITVSINQWHISAVWELRKALCNIYGEVS
jgi:hypothetical protein